MITTRLPLREGKWFTDWNPSKRPIQLPLPKLEYDSHFEVWEWKFRNVLKHNSLLWFINHPESSVTGSLTRTEQQEETAAATHCLALLGSCVSEDILADLLTLSTDNKLHGDPYRLFVAIKSHVSEVQHLWKRKNPMIWSSFTRRDVEFETVEDLLDATVGTSRAAFREICPHNLMLMTVLLVKRKFPFYPHQIVRKYITKARDEKIDISDQDWSEMRSTMMSAASD